MIKFRIFLMLFLFPLIAVKAEQEAIEKFMKSVHDNRDNITDLTFVMESSDISKLLDEKLVIIPIDNMKIKYYWANGKYDNEVLINKNTDSELVKIIKDEFREKIQFVIHTDFKDFIYGYDYKGIVNGFDVWFDPTGLKDISEIGIKIHNNQIVVNQKGTSNISNTVYNYKKYEWSKDKLALESVDKDITNSIQNIQIKYKINYEKHEKFHLPSVIEVMTIHAINNDNQGNYERSISTMYRFSDYQINRNDALRWLTTR
jgi:hypothetical protein